MEFRVDRVVQDGTNRIGDLEFRLCELESDCDIGQLEQGTTLGGVTPATGNTTTDTDGAASTDGPQLAVGEQADFDTATQALNEGSHAAAAEQFAAFLDNYPGSPLAADAGLKRGEALEGAGAVTDVRIIR